MMNLDDPKLTAYALGELSEEEAVAIERGVAQSPEAQARVAEVRQLSRALREGFLADLQETKPRNIMPLPAERSFWSDNRWLSLGLAAVLAVAAVIGAVLLSQGREGGLANGRARPVGLPPLVMEYELAAATEASPGQNGFVTAAAKPISSFPVTIGSGSYSELRRALAGGALPAPETIKVEELINAFSYDDPAPADREAVALSVEVATCPWENAHRLARITVKAARAVRETRAQVNFNTSAIAAYRLIGFDDAISRSTDGTGEMKAGQAVTVLYEVVPAAGPLPDAQTLTASIEYKEPEDVRPRVVFHSCVGYGGHFGSASADFKFAAAVAEFGLLLRGQLAATQAQLEAVAARAADGRGFDRDGRRAELITLVQQAQQLRKG